jgi:hypothetical protein
MGLERRVRAVPVPPDRGRHDFVPDGLRRASELGWRFLVVAGATVVIALLVARLRIVLVPTAVALLIACAFWPLAARLRRLGLPPALAALLPLLLSSGRSRPPSPSSPRAPPTSSTTST